MNNKTIFNIWAVLVSCAVLTIGLVILKLMGIYTHSWWDVFAPVWIWPVTWVICGSIMVLAFIVEKLCIGKRK